MDPVEQMDHMDENEDDKFLMSNEEYKNPVPSLVAPFPGSNARALNFSIGPLENTPLFQPQSFTLPIAPNNVDKRMVDDLKKQLSRMQEDKDKLEIENESLKMQLYNAQVQNISAKPSGACSGCSSLRDEITRHKTALNVQMEENRQLNNKIQNHMKEVQEMRYHNEELHQQLQQTETNDTGVKSKIAELNREVKNANEAKRKAERDYAMKAKEVSSLTEKIDKLEKFNQRLKQKEEQEKKQLLEKTVAQNVREYKMQTEKMQQQLQKYKTEEAKRESVEQKCIEYLKTITDHEATIKEFATELEQEKALSSQIDEQLVDVSDKFKSLSEAYNNLQLERDHLNATVEQLTGLYSALQKEFVGLKEQNNVQASEIINWTEHCQEYKEQVESLMTKLEKARSESSMYAEKLRQLDEAYGKQHSELQKSLQYAEELVTDVERLNAETQDQQQFLVEQEEKLEETHSMLQDRERQIVRLKKEIDTQVESNNSQRTELNESLQQCIAYQQSIKDLQAVNAEQKKAIHQRDERVDQLETQKREIAEALNNARDAYQKLQNSQVFGSSQSSQLQSMLNAKDSELDKWRAKSNTMKTELRQYEQTVLNVSREKDELQREVEELRGNYELIEKLKQQNNKLRQENDELVNSMYEEQSGGSHVSDEKLTAIKREYERLINEKNQEIQQLNNDLDESDKRMQDLEEERDELLKDKSYANEEKLMMECERLRKERDRYKNLAQQSSTMRDITNQQPGSVVKKGILKV
jgi:chromosome segregation ATPase